MYTVDTILVGRFWWVASAGSDSDTPEIVPNQLQFTEYLTLVLRRDCRWQVTGRIRQMRPNSADATHDNTVDIAHGFLVHS